MVTGLFPGQTEALKCRRSHLKCNGVWTCEFIDPSLFAGCERNELDAAAMRELWKHELDVNECEAASAPGIISRFNLLSGASLSPNSNNVDEDTLRIAMENGGQLINFIVQPILETLRLQHTHISFRVKSDTKTLAPKKKQPRAPEVNEALIIEGSRLRTKSRRALGEQ
ncbi:hypothetical protein B0H14DRAFT_2580891 [Mycena olivaceomarginata]|nr:hypothetical protein B0H14DRAFT_2580891 [Mycena olivaceomarginata]